MLRLTNELGLDEIELAALVSWSIDKDCLYRKAVN